jgi:Histidine kinase-like ATPase domain
MKTAIYNSDDVIFLSSADDILSQVERIDLPISEGKIIDLPLRDLKDHKLGKEVAVTVLDLNNLNGDYLNQFLSLFEETPLKNSELLLISDTSQNDYLLPKLLDKSSHQVFQITESQKIVDAIKQSKAKFKSRAYLTNEMKNLDNCLKMLNQASFKLKSLKEAKELSVLLGSMCPQNTEATIGLLELMINSIEHGNLEISYDKKGQLLKDGVWHTEVLRRLVQEKYSHKFITVDYTKTSERVTFLITDEGEGFNFEYFLTAADCGETEKPSTKFHGRGIALTKQLCFDELTYLGRGNQVRVSVNLV